MDVDGPNIERLTEGSENVYGPAWSPDGSTIAYRAHLNGEAADIYLLNLQTKEAVNLTNHPAEDWAPAWSPDGNWIAFQTDRDGNWEIYAIQIDGSGEMNLTRNAADDQMPYWR
jgi:Tol biopolymer transport system component